MNKPGKSTNICARVDNYRAGPEVASYPIGIPGHLRKNYGIHRAGSRDDCGHRRLQEVCVQSLMPPEAMVTQWPVSGKSISGASANGPTCYDVPQPESTPETLMRRADRLFQIILLLGGKKVVTAQHLAAELQVSERTVYRDIRDLTLSGVPIEGEAGVGYVLRRGFQVPPLMFSTDELRALVLGTRMVEGFTDEVLRAAARQALAKIGAVLPDALKEDLDNTSLLVPDFHVPKKIREYVGIIRPAIDAHRKIQFAYVRADGTFSDRIVRPLALTFWGSQWTLAAWCEMREDFRTFRLDRMKGPAVLATTFDQENGRGINDYLARMLD